MSNEKDYFDNKKTYRTYISKPITTREGESLRYISKVIDSEAHYEFAKVKNEVVLRVTPGSRQEVLAKLVEVGRRVYVLSLQRYTTRTGMPHQLSFSFLAPEIQKLRKFLDSIEDLPLSEQKSTRIDDAELESLALSREQASKMLHENREVFLEILRNELSVQDIAVLALKKAKLKVFHRLLNDEEYFSQVKEQTQASGDEMVWQRFFEENTWILGYGLNYVFTSTLDNAKLERFTKGSNFLQSGHRVDALMKTRGLISSLCFAEIKTHKTRLLSPKQYRAGSWSISSDLAGSISQVQKAVHDAIKDISERIQPTDRSGHLTGEEIFLYKPRSILVIGHLSEFRGPHGVHQEQFSSFELFRRSVGAPEILTYDELYERAKYIVQKS